MISMLAQSIRVDYNHHISQMLVHVLSLIIQLSNPDLDVFKRASNDTMEFGTYDAMVK